MGRSKVIDKESILVDNLIVIDAMQITNSLIMLGNEFSAPPGEQIIAWSFRIISVEVVSKCAKIRDSL